MDTRSILGMPALRSAFLDNVSAAGQAETCRACQARGGLIVISCDDDIDEDRDDDDDDFFDTDEDDDNDEDAEDDEDDVETWQVRTAAQISAKSTPCLDFRS
jgi:hypothetical protein